MQVLAEEEVVVGAGEVPDELLQGLEGHLAEAAVEAALAALVDDVPVHGAEVLEQVRLLLEHGDAETTREGLFARVHPQVRLEVPAHAELLAAVLAAVLAHRDALAGGGGARGRVRRRRRTPRRLVGPGAAHLRRAQRPRAPRDVAVAPGAGARAGRRRRRRGLRTVDRGRRRRGSVRRQVGRREVAGAEGHLVDVGGAEGHEGRVLRGGVVEAGAALPVGRHHVILRGRADHGGGVVGLVGGVAVRVDFGVRELALAPVQGNVEREAVQRLLQGRRRRVRLDLRPLGRRLQTSRVT